MAQKGERVRKVLSYNKGLGGELERAMEDLGELAESNDIVREVFILGVAAYLAGLHTFRRGDGPLQLVRLMDNNIQALQMARTILDSDLDIPGAPSSGSAARPRRGKAQRTANHGATESTQHQARVDGTTATESSIPALPEAPAAVVHASHQPTARPDAAVGQVAAAEDPAKSSTPSRASTPVIEAGDQPHLDETIGPNKAGATTSAPAQSGEQVRALSPSPPLGPVQNGPSDAERVEKNASQSASEAPKITVKNLAKSDGELTISTPPISVNPLTTIEAGDSENDEEANEAARNAEFLMSAAMDQF